MRRMKRRWKVLGLAGLTVLAVSSQGVFARTDAFKCYQAQEVFIEQPRPAVLTDSLGSDPDVRIHNAAWFCAPTTVSVGAEEATAITAPSNHMTLVPLSNTNPGGKQNIRVENQFGVQTIEVTTPRFVAVPTRKDLEPAPDGLSHFKCYVASGTPLDLDVNLSDELQMESVTLGQPKYFCNPASMTVGGATTAPQADEASLVCYKMAPGTKPLVEKFTFDNRIGFEDTMRLGSSNFMCVPSTVLTGAPGNARTSSATVK